MASLEPMPNSGEKAVQEPHTSLRALFWGVMLGVVYLLIFRGMTFIKPFAEQGKGGVILMSFAFLFLGPLISGFLTIYRKPTEAPISKWQWVFVPWLTILINIIVAFAFHWEGLVCVVFILPPALVFATVGGIVAGQMHRSARVKLSGKMLPCLAALPLMLAIVETQLHQPLIVRTVHSEIAIHASPEKIWSNIKRVPAIAPSELRPSWAVAIGFPRPIEATLSYEGVGGVRNASFERGLTFIETVNVWEPNRRIAFNIRADTDHIPPTTLDEHVTIGGRFFDVLNGEYFIEPKADGSSVLHLTSHQRLSTDFNRYASLWSDAVMQDLQTNILQVIQHRCEQRIN